MPGWLNLPNLLTLARLGSVPFLVTFIHSGRYVPAAVLFFAAAVTECEVEVTVARVGGGALPLAELESFACAVEEALAGPLRGGDPPVVGIVRDGRLLFDCRTLADAEVDEVARAVTAQQESQASGAPLAKEASGRRAGQYTEYGQAPTAKHPAAQRRQAGTEPGSARRRPRRPGA